MAQATQPVTTSVNEQEAIHKVLGGYYDAFGRDSAAASASFYGEPTLIIRPNDVVLLTSRADIEAFFDKFVAGLKSSGYSHSKLGDHRVKLPEFNDGAVQHRRNSHENGRHRNAAVRLHLPASQEQRRMENSRNYRH